MPTMYIEYHIYYSDPPQYQWGLRRPPNLYQRAQFSTDFLQIWTVRIQWVEHETYGFWLWSSFNSGHHHKLEWCIFETIENTMRLLQGTDRGDRGIHPMQSRATGQFSWSICHLLVCIHWLGWTLVPIWHVWSLQSHFLCRGLGGPQKTNVLHFLKYY